MNKTMLALVLVMISSIGQASAQTIQVAPVSPSAGWASTGRAVVEAAKVSNAAPAALAARIIASAAVPADREAQAGTSTVSALKWIYAVVTSDARCETRTHGVQVNFNLPY